MNRFLLTSLLLFISCITSQKNSTKQIPLVENLDIKQFTTGKWYEIARIPIPIGGDWVNTTSTYTLTDEKNISALYEGFKEKPNGEKKELKGKAEIISPSLWRISYLFFIYSDYRIIKVSPDYSTAMITSDSKEYLWILSKTPSMKDSTYQEYLTFARDNSFPVEKLERVKQEW